MDGQDPELEVRERAAVVEVVTAMLRHDLRNRFSSIRNAAYYLMRQTQKAELWKADPRMETLFQLIDSELASAEALLSARVMKGPEEQRGRLRLCDVAEQALARTRIPPSVHVERTWQEQGLVEADGERLVLLTRCLIENAVEAMQDGGTLTVRTEKRDEGRILLEVSDTGPGITEDLRKRVFEPFVTTKPGHAGVGLCIVQRIALRNRAWVELVPGEPVGTRVMISFPAAGETGVSGGA
jgi:signal transduction histidine kinase